MSFSKPDKLPALQFYPGDWKKDPGVQALSLEERAVWLEMLMLMHESDERGKLLLNGLPMPNEALARILGLDPLRVKERVETILAYGVASRDEDGVIYSRRMVRDEANRKAMREAGKLGGNPALTASYNRPGYVYVMRRASDGAVKIGISENPTKRLYRIRYQQKQEVELLVSCHVADMGKSEAELHKQYSQAADGEWFALKEHEIVALVSTLKGKGEAIPTPSSSSSSSSSISSSSSDKEKQTHQSPSDCTVQFSLNPSQEREPETPKGPSDRDRDKWFDEQFWPTIWAKIGVAEARKAFRRKARTIEDARLIVKASRSQREAILQRAAATTNGTPIHPATWLNQERYRDEVPELPKLPHTANGTSSAPTSNSRAARSNAILDEIARQA